MKKQHLAIILALIIVLILALVFTVSLIRKNNSKINASTESIFAGKENVLTYTDINGNPVALRDFLGKIIVVTTWASWSPFSEADLTTMNRLAESYNGEEVVFMAINRKETRELAQRYISTLPNLDRIIMVIDQEDFFYQSVGGYAMPESVIFDKKGEVVDHIRGVLNEERIREIISQTQNKELSD